MIYYKGGQVSLQNGGVFSVKRRTRLHYKVGQVLQSRANFHYKVNFYYKVRQVLHSWAIITKQCHTESKWEKWERAKAFGKLLLDSTLIFLVKDNLLLGIPEKFKFC